MKDLKKLVSQMTLEEKIGQLIQLHANFFGTDSELTGPAQEWGLNEKQMSTIGSCIGGKDAASIRRVQEEHLRQDRNKIPLMFMHDVIHGYHTVYPIGIGMAGTFDPELVEKCAEMAAKESAAGGSHVTFAPMVDLTRDARWGRVMEASGEDPYLASCMAAAQVKGYQGDDVSSHDRIVSCVKHFAAYGGAEGGRDYNDIEISNHHLRQNYLPTYKACVDAGVKMLMPSFNNVNGIPSTVNTFLMNDVLRGEWGFNGTVISDWAAITEVCDHGLAKDHKEAALLAFKCGCHIEMCSDAYFKHLAELVDEGAIKESEIDEAVLNVLKLKDDLGLFDDPFHGGDDERGKALYRCEEHLALVRKAAEESAVLLKNDGVLPFSANVKRIALVGPFAEEKAIQGGWSAFGTAEETVSVYEGVKALLPNAEIVTAKGCEYVITDTDVSKIADAVEVAKTADAVVICVGEPMNYSGEGHCRTNIKLPGVQEELIKAVTKVNKNVAVVLFNGRPLDLSNVYKDAPSILEAWFPGSEGGNAVANILFGYANPSGKLAMSFPKNAGQCPIYYNRRNTGRPKTIEDDVHQPYKCGYIDCGTLPLFFFGEGLSYSNFKYLDMTLDKTEITKTDAINVKVTVKNDSDRAGKEVIQLYLRDKACSVVRPVQELIAFKKVEIGAGETITVDFEITEPMLRFWNAKCEFVSEPGEFKLFVGYADHEYITTEFKLI